MEEWRDIKGYEGLYQVSNIGNVRSVTHTTVHRDGKVVRYEGKTLTPHNGDNGYKCVNLSKNGLVNLANVHRLVAETFLPKDDGKEAKAVHERQVLQGKALQRRKAKDGDGTQIGRSGVHRQSA